MLTSTIRSYRPPRRKQPSDGVVTAKRERLPESQGVILDSAVGTTLEHPRCLHLTYDVWDGSLLVSTDRQAS